MELSAILKARFKQLPESGGWVMEVTPPFPERWPEDPLVYYATAWRLPPRVADGQDVATPWAKIDERGNVTLLTECVTLFAQQGIRPLTGPEIALLDEVQRAGPLEELWRRARQDAAVAMLLRRWYCHWCKVRYVSRDVLARHPEFLAFLDCASVTITVEPVRQPHPIDLVGPEFRRRYGEANRVWDDRNSPPFPMVWPAKRDTAFAYYAWSTRALQSGMWPKRETSEPWGIVTRAGVGGALTFSALHDLPPSLGIQSRQHPSDEYRKLRDALGDIDEALVRAGQDAATAEQVRGYYQEWLSIESLIAPLVLARHPEFAAFIHGAG